MKVYVTGVCGQLGHDVMNELARRGHEGIGSDLAPVYGGAQDGSAVCGMPYERWTSRTRKRCGRASCAQGRTR